jgi:cobalt-zinc-cadmium efflux system outer membrane protein
LDRAVKSREIQLAEAQLNAQRSRILSDVRGTYYRWLVSQQRLEQTEELAAIGQRVYMATDKLLEAKQASENDLLQAQIQRDRAEILRDTAHAEKREAMRRLATVVGMPDTTFTIIPEPSISDFPTLTWDESLASLLAANPALQAAKCRASAARAEWMRAKKEPIPNLDLMLGARHDNDTGDDVADVQVAMALPVFNRNQGNNHAAWAEWVRACNDAKRLELELQDQLATVYRNYESAQLQAERYLTAIIPNAKQSLDLVTGGYDQGQVEFLTLLTAQQTYVEAQLTYLASLQELWAAATQIQSRLLSNSLAER